MTMPRRIDTQHGAPLPSREPDGTQHTPTRHQTHSRVSFATEDQSDALRTKGRKMGLALLKYALGREGFEASYAADRQLLSGNSTTNTIATPLRIL